MMTLCRTRQAVATLLLLALTLPAISQEVLDGVRGIGANSLQVGVPFEPTAFTMRQQRAADIQTDHTQW